MKNSLLSVGKVSEKFGFSVNFPHSKPGIESFVAETVEVLKKSIAEKIGMKSSRELNSIYWEILWMIFCPICTNSSSSCLYIALGWEWKKNLRHPIGTFSFEKCNRTLFFGPVPRAFTQSPKLVVCLAIKGAVFRELLCAWGKQEGTLMNIKVTLN